MEPDHQPSPSVAPKDTTILGHPRDLVLLADRSGAILSANQTWRDALGYEPEELRGMSLFDLVQWQDHAACEAWLQRAGSGDTGTPVRMLLLARRGAEVQVEGVARSSPGSEGSVFEGVFRDVSDQRRAEVARRESEERFRLLSAHVPVGVFQTDPDGRLTYTNPRWRKMAGLSDLTEPRGVWWQAVHPDDRERVVREWRSALHHGHECASEFRVRSTPGSLRWARARLARVCGPEGRVRAWIGVSEDISEHKREQAELAAARDAALEAASLKARFLANLRHEVQAPLEAVVGWLDKLGESNLTTEQRQLAAAARDGVRQIVHGLCPLFDLSRIGITDVATEPVLFSLKELTEACVKALAPQAEARGLKLVAAVDPRLPDRLEGDPKRLRQVLTHLVGNALKFTPQGHVELAVSRKRLAGSTVLVQFSVQDTGIGIPAETVDRLFLPFAQWEGPNTRPPEGAGLGLAIARRLVEMMGGDLGVESRVGEGSHFWFSVPLAVARRTSA